MAIGATILMILFFPLNFFLMLGQGFSDGSQVQAREISVQGAVQGAETEIVKIKPQATDDPQYQPIKLASATNLAVPNAHAFAIIDADTGQLLAGSHSSDQRQIASLTKMMTANLTMENIKDLNVPVTIDDEEVYIEGTKIGCPRSGYCISQRLKIGEQISAGNLLQAMLMNSANDAATALGKYMGGTSDAFADMMNKRAKQMGLSNTHFCTPSGLEPDDPAAAANCYSSAYDIGRIAAYDLRYPLLWKIFKMPTDSQISSVDGQTVHTILNSDLVLNDIPNIIGGKTGFTPLAGYSLLMAVSDPTGKHRAIEVLLGDNNRWSDIKTMIDWTFKSYTWQ
jgi:D-alanyl-D-alanine carboxypeptidase (penicillin-binding protein 5/6)